MGFELNFNFNKSYMEGLKANRNGKGAIHISFGDDLGRKAKVSELSAARLVLLSEQHTHKGKARAGNVYLYGMPGLLNLPLPTYASLRLDMRSS